LLMRNSAAQTASDGDAHGVLNELVTQRTSWRAA